MGTTTPRRHHVIPRPCADYRPTTGTARPGRPSTETPCWHRRNSGCSATRHSARRPRRSVACRSPGTMRRRRPCSRTRHRDTSHRRSHTESSSRTRRSWSRTSRSRGGCLRSTPLPDCTSRCHTARAAGSACRRCHHPRGSPPRRTRSRSPGLRGNPARGRTGSACPCSRGRCSKRPRAHRSLPEQVAPEPKRYQEPLASDHEVLPGPRSPLPWWRG